MATSQSKIVPEPYAKGKFLRVYLKQIRRIWRALPGPVRKLPAGRAFGRHVDRIVRMGSNRTQHFATFFLRNRPELEMLRRVVDRQPQGAAVNLTVLACSKGAEVYSMVWAIRSARPDLKVKVQALDISQAIVEFAERGIYSLRRHTGEGPSSEEVVRRKASFDQIPSSDRHAWLFERVTDAEMEAIFEVRGEEAIVKPWLREGVTWRVGDAGDPNLLNVLGSQDIVVANRFLCHMAPPDAENCLRNIGRLVAPGGYLFVSGLDLDVRSKIAREQKWAPVTELIHELHEGDDSLRNAWPLEWWGLEPLDETRPDWQLRYASVFQIGASVRASLAKSTQPALARQ